MSRQQCAEALHVPNARCGYFDVLAAIVGLSHLAGEARNDRAMVFDLENWL